MNDSQRQREIERCRRELATIEAELKAGNPDIEGLCLALADWSAELRLLEEECRQAAGLAAEGSSAERAYLGRP